jgi:hypothetical protein
MLVETQTTIRILIVAAAGVATVALARPVPSGQASEAEVSLATPSVEAPAGTASSGPHGEATAGFAVFCEDRR